MSLLILTLVSFACFAPVAQRVGSASAHMSPATISDKMTADFPPPPADAENPATSAASSAGEVGIPAIRYLIETKSASISPDLPKIYNAEWSEAPKKTATPAAPSIGVFFPHRKLMTAAVESNSTESQGY